MGEPFLLPDFKNWALAFSDDISTPHRSALIEGTAEQIEKATRLISEIIDRTAAGDRGDFFHMHVPANKAGLVIGKGGENVKQLCADSGAHIELSREPPPNPFEKIFIIRGSPQQIHHAQHLIRIKVGDIPPDTPLPQFEQGSASGRGDVYDLAQNVGSNASRGYGGGTTHLGAAVAGQWTGQWNVGVGNQLSDASQAACAQQCYGQQSQQHMGYPPSAYTMQYQQPLFQSAHFTTASTVNPHTGQPDYSAQWAEYYRSIGMHDQAAAIENHLKMNAVSATAVRSFVQSAEPSQQFVR
ncbi:Far upstream element-binding protein 1 [Toxocara canis]|uniref:Far upstream element-binding protein 1 n=1 Tax=Toxocara canis TaxID=6265 RepID=A0A0B2URV9_TOXCA|nr:Far upstream element-binding protein 1 [Toxocara canis]